MFGHWDVVTCLAYSRHVGLTGGDAFVVSGSRDATVLVWRWSERLQRVTASDRAEGEYEIDHNSIIMDGEAKKVSGLRTTSH